MLLGRSEALLRVAGRSIGKATGGRGSDSAKPPGFDKVSPVPFCPELA
jgi:hypothetical protein